jgi:predicted aspartyl protease
MEVGELEGDWSVDSVVDTLLNGYVLIGPPARRTLLAGPTDVGACAANGNCPI